MGDQAKERLRELSQVRGQRPLSEAEWEEAGLLFAELGQRDQATHALREAARVRQERETARATSSAPASAQPEHPGSTPSAWGPVPSARRLVWVAGITLALFVVCVGGLMLADEAGRAEAEAKEQAEGQETASRRVAVQEAADGAMPGIQRALAEAGTTVRWEVTENAGLDLWITVPTLMTKQEAREVARLVTNKIPLPSGTVFAARVLSPSGQYLDTYMDARM